MTTDTKAVLRWNSWGGERDIQESDDGQFVLFKDHERAVGDLDDARRRWCARAGEYLKRAQAAEDALAASRAEVEGMKKDADRYRWIREDYDPSIHDDGFEPLFSLGPDNLDAEIDAMIDAAMENGNV